jgi:hypothetical protein
MAGADAGSRISMEVLVEQQVVRDGGACKERYRSLTFIVRSSGERPRLQIRMAATRDLPKVGSSCTTVVIARDNGN